MKQGLLALTLSGCVATAGIVKEQVQDYSSGGSLATGLAFTAVDAAVGCLTGACTSPRL